jgi:hypothetical protein
MLLQIPQSGGQKFFQYLLHGFRQIEQFLFDERRTEIGR